MLVTAVKLPVEEETPEAASLRPPVFFFAGGFSRVGLASHDDLLSVRARRARHHILYSPTAKLEKP
jgi:hypothetical protein